jgi:hypothetical protein
MNGFKIAGKFCLTASLLAATAFGQDGGRCKTVTGKALWTTIKGGTPTEQRILGPTTGGLKGAVTAYLTKVEVLAGPPNLFVFKAESVETWVLGAGDSLTFEGLAYFTQLGQPFPAGPTPAPGPPPPFDVSDFLTLTVKEGTGAYKGATGTLFVAGIGVAFGPGAAVGQTYFDLTYRGSICKAAAN